MVREFTGRNMAFLVLSFFVVVVSVNVTMAVIASKSWTGLVVENSYVASQQFNEKTAELERSAAMNVHAVLTYRAGEIVVRVSDSSGAAIATDALTLRIGRPSYEGEDRSITMTCAVDGSCRAPAQLGPGLWTGEVEAQFSNGLSWLRAVDLFVVKGQSG